MTITTKVARLEPVIFGHTSEGKDWEKQIVILRIPETERVIAIEFFGMEKTAITKELKEGDMVQATYSVFSEEYQGKWYNRVQGISIMKYQRV